MPRPKGRQRKYDYREDITPEELEELKKKNKRIKSGKYIVKKRKKRTRKKKYDYRKDITPEELEELRKKDGKIKSGKYLQKKYYKRKKRKKKKKPITKGQIYTKKHNRLNREKYEKGERKTDSGFNYEPNYHRTGRFYMKEEHQNPDGTFKEGNSASSYKHNRKLTKKEFRKQMNEIAMNKITEEDIEKIMEQLIAMAKKGNLNAIKEIKDYCLGKEGQQNTLDVNVKKEELVWNYGFDEAPKRKQIESKTPDDDIIDVEVEEDTMEES